MCTRTTSQNTFGPIDKRYFLFSGLHHFPFFHIIEISNFKEGISMVILVLVILAVIILGGSYYAYRLAFFSPAEGRNKVTEPIGKHYDPFRGTIEEMFRVILARPCEEIAITSHDGLTLMGRYYHTADGAPLCIGFHGYKSTYVADFSGGSALCIAQGCNLLLVDQRAHGKSDGNTISFGILERRDVLSWVNYAVHRFGANTKICLMGVSMGAATVLMAAGLDLPKNVKGIVADCPFAKASDIIVEVGKKMGFPAWFTVPFARLGAWIFGRFDLYETDAVGAVKQAKVPILIIHGEADTLVPQEMSQLVRLANPEMVRRVTFPNAGHAMSYLVDTERYWDIAIQIFKEIFP